MGTNGFCESITWSVPTFRLKGTVLIYLFYDYLPDSLNGLTAQLIETYCHVMGESTIYTPWGSLIKMDVDTNTGTSAERWEFLWFINFVHVYVGYFLNSLLPVILINCIPVSAQGSYFCEMCILFQ